MSKEFKVGQRVKIRAWEDMKKEFGVDFDGDIMTSPCFVDDMKIYCGLEAKITEIYNANRCKLRFKKEVKGCYEWTYSTDMLEPLAETIVIYRKDSEVIALDKRTGNKAVAKCSPADTFNFETGAKLAFDRLMDREDNEVKRYAKIGEYVKVVDAKGCSSMDYRNGDILKIVKSKYATYKNDGSHHKGYAWIIDRIGGFLYPTEYVVLENYEPPKKLDEIKIFDTVKVIDDGALYSTYATWKGLGKYEQNWVNGSCISKDKVYTVLNIEEHGGHENDVMALVQDKDTTQVFIIGLRGLEKIG